MRTIGFSTGALAFADFRRGLEISRRHKVAAVELSALREPELGPLVTALDHLDLTQFSYVAVHAPSAIGPNSERRVVEQLGRIRERGWNVIVHPDVIREPSLWASLGNSLCIENMDKRKPTGRTCLELQTWFDRFPEATFCLDLGHARQCDPTLSEAYFMLKRFSGRMRQMHVSEVTARSNHDRLSRACILAFQEIAKYVPESVPIIMETPMLDDSDIAEQVQRVLMALPVSAPTLSVDPVEGGLVC